jgi:hypothetical protein
MKRSRNVLAAATAVALSIAVAGCDFKNEVAPPDGQTPGSPSKTPTTVLAGSVLSQAGIVNSLVTHPPAVIVLDQNHTAMSGVEVSFVVTHGEGSVAPDRVRTDKDGIARTSWRLGETTGDNTLTANVSGIQPVVFSANSFLPGSLPELRGTQWDLVEVGGKKLPLTYSGGDSSWSITGGHYVFLDDSTYAWGYDVNGVGGARYMGRYVIDAFGAVQFFDASGFLFSTGTIQGNLVTVTYADIIDFEVEIYVLPSN